MTKRLSRRDFLKLAGVTSAGLALSACGVNATELPTITPLSPTSTLSPTKTPIPTVTATSTPLVPTLRTVGEKLGIVFSTTVDGAEEYRRPEYQKAAGLYFSSIFPSGSFMQSTFNQWGLDLAKHFRNLADQYNQILYVHMIFWHQDVDENLKSASKDEVVKFMENRVRTILKFVNKADGNHKPTYINFFNEALRYWRGAKGLDIWENSPYFRAYGDQLITQSYLMVYRIAQENGLVAGKDFRLIYNDYDIFRLGGKANVVFNALSKAKTDIAKELGISESEVQLDVGMQYHLDVNTPVDNTIGYFKVPTDDEMLECMQKFSEIGRIHVTEFDVMNTQSQSEYTEILNRVTQTAIKSNLCDSINYWYGLRVFETDYDRKTRESGRENFYHPIGLFDRNYNPTDVYDSLLQGLIQLANEK